MVMVDVAGGGWQGQSESAAVAGGVAWDFRWNVTTEQEPEGKGHGGKLWAESGKRAGGNAGDIRSPCGRTQINLQVHRKEKCKVWVHLMVLKTHDEYLFI